MNSEFNYPIGSVFLANRQAFLYTYLGEKNGQHKFNVSHPFTNKFPKDTYVNSHSITWPSYAIELGYLIPVQLISDEMKSDIHNYKQNKKNLELVATKTKVVLPNDVQNYIQAFMSIGHQYTKL